MGFGNVPGPSLSAGETMMRTSYGMGNIKYGEVVLGVFEGIVA
jgi:hypothetical protein